MEYRVEAKWAGTPVGRWTWESKHKSKRQAERAARVLRRESTARQVRVVKVTTVRERERESRRER